MERIRWLTVIAMVINLWLALPLASSAQGVRPGTTVGETCSKYKVIPSYPEMISYYQCQNGNTVKFLHYYAANCESFNCVECHDAYGSLIESRFSRSTALDPTGDIALADSVSP